MSKGLLIAAPSSGSGKTTLTLGLLRALHQRGETVRGAKSGPDYIDPRFHEAACGAPCPNLDAWAMTPERLGQLAGGHGTLIVEGAMGLFDGAPHPDPALDGKGSAAHLAKTLGLPIVLVIDVARMAGSVAALVRGFLTHDPALNIRGLILNQVGSPRHATLLTRALAPLDIPLLGTIPRSKALAHPGRHLGLVQAGERPDLDHFLNEVAETVEAGVDLQALLDCAAPLTPYGAPKRLAPPAQSMRYEWVQTHRSQIDAPIAHRTAPAHPERSRDPHLPRIPTEGTRAAWRFPRVAPHRVHARGSRQYQ